MTLCEARREVELGANGYPARVAALRNAPERLYVRGDLNVLEQPSLAVVGSRRATPYGLALAEMAGQIAAESGLVVVSGGAMGCDQAAGHAAMRAGGRHVVVLGTGADVPYPKTAAVLIERALETGGAVVSLMPWGTDPMPWAFPRRNRVIAALSDALFVTEAGMPSGTFSTAETAVELGHEVLAAPGSILSPQSRGANHLISNGACCIVDEDALEVAISRIYGVLRFCRGKAPGNQGLSSQERRALRILTANPLRLTEIAHALKLDELSCMRLLSGMEITGFAERLLDGRYSPTKRALHALTPLGQNGHDQPSSA